MAHENVMLQQSNFCMGPQAGTVCSIDTTNPKTVLRVKNMTGATIIDLELSSNILNDNVRVEYVGPPTLDGVHDGLTFFTFEKVSDSSCMIKRWETRIAYRELLLKEQVVKSTSGNERYNAIDFAVEYYYRAFTRSNEQYNYLEMNSVFNVKNSTRLFFGPSTDTDNIGATEVGVVSHIIDHIDGKRVYLTAPLKYQYVIGDLITFYSNIYIYSSEGYADDPNKGTLFKIDAYTWDTKEIDTKAIYKRANASRWCPMVGGIATIIGHNMLFVRPYDEYLNWRSMFLNNVMSDNNTIFTVYDVGFDNYSIYKLQGMTTLVDDTNKKTTHDWDSYNLQPDSLLPHTQSVATWLDQSIITGYNKNVDIYAQVRDQFYVGLRDVYLTFYMLGDGDALFDPLSGNVVTDLNGKATINYRSGQTYNGHTEITARATGGSTSTGSAYVWTSNNVISYPETEPIKILLWAIFYISAYNPSLKQIIQIYSVFNREENPQWRAPFYTLRGSHYFTSPGGNWSPTKKLKEYEPEYVGGGGSVLEYLPMLYEGEDHLDAPACLSPGYGFEYPSPFPDDFEDGEFLFSNRITVFEELKSKFYTFGLTYYLLYKGSSVGQVPFAVIVQPDESGNGQISQLKLSLHTHWVDGLPYDELWTYSNIDQFVFVEDAVPKFWSSKNLPATNIWVRLRPFAFSLNNSTLRMWVREDSYLSDTGYCEVTDSIQIVNFDAGGGMLGIEITYNPVVDFKYGSTVYVRIEVYDIAHVSNYIFTEYWFRIVPDYKSPYVSYMVPDNGEIDVSVDSHIYFELKDEGTGINIETLEILLNSRRIDVNYLTIEEVSRRHFKITYISPEGLFYNKDYKIAVKVEDTSSRKNALNTSWEFYTVESTGVQMVLPTPGPCKAGMNRFEDVSVVILGDGNGVDKDTIRMQVFNKDIHSRITPIIYRVS